MKNEEYTYNYSIDFNTVNTASVILSQIRKKSNILELGPSTGYMTKYLKEELECNVTCIEIDEDSAQFAKKYCDNMIIGNLDNLILSNFLKEKFDYILIADVLEHLYFPEKLLRELTNFLASEGRIFVSIPNISHVAFLHHLMHNEFNYYKWGLLDNTHIRFFTKESFINLVKKNNLLVNNIIPIIKDPSETEFNLNLDNIPNFLLEYIRINNPDYLNYQYVFELALSTPANIKIKELCEKIDFYKKDESSILLKSKLYFDFGEGYSEVNSVQKDFNVINNKFQIIFDNFNESVSKYCDNIRFDPTEGEYCYLQLIEVSYFNHLNEEIFIPLTKVKSNADYMDSNNGMYFLNDDPQVYFNIPNIYLRKIKVSGILKEEKNIEIIKHYKGLCERNLEQKDIIIQKINEDKNLLLNEIENRKQKEIILNNELEKTIDEYQSLLEQLSERDRNIENLIKQNNQLKVIITQQQETIHNDYES